MIKLPKECEVNKFLPKKLFYEKVYISNSIKQEFTNKIDKITWKYKIAESNINISKTENIEEIEVFEIILREKYSSKNILKVITKEIPYPILFILKYETEYQYAIKYEEMIYFSEWNKKLLFNFIDYNLDKVYENIVKVITNIIDNSKSIKNELEKKQEIVRIEAEITKLENQIKKEQQFNKKVELNKKLVELKNEMEMYKKYE